MPNLPMSEVTAERIADWVETSVLFSDDPSVSLASLADMLSEDGGVDSVELYDRAHADPALLEAGEIARSARDIRAEQAEGIDLQTTIVADAFAILQYRERIVGGHYPFSFSGSTVRRAVASWEHSLPYAFMLAASARHLYRLDIDFHRPARLFERLVVHALKQYWCGEAQHFGWPRSDEDEPSFQRALPRLASRMGQRLLVDPTELRYTHKDLQLDAVAWRSMDDRSGTLALLCQCAIASDWDQKSVTVERWEKLIQFDVRPVRAIAFPFVPGAVRPFDQTEWALLCSQGIPLDRLRIAKLVDPNDLEARLAENLSDWTGEAVASIVATL